MSQNIDRSSKQAEHADDPATAQALTWGWVLLALFLPLGLTLEALHALKVAPYLDSPMRRELWTLAHAHGNLLGILCLAFAAVGRRTLPDAGARAFVSRWLRYGSALMPLGFFAGGLLNYEGDPSLGILLVPVGAVCLLAGLARAGLSAWRTPGS